MIVVTDGNHAESEHNASRRPDVKAQLPPEEICERAEDESSQDEPDHGESIEVSNHHGLQCCSITFCIIIITQTGPLELKLEWTSLSVVISHLPAHPVVVRHGGVFKLGLVVFPLRARHGLGSLLQKYFKLENISFISVFQPGDLPSLMRHQQCPASCP